MAVWRRVALSTGEHWLVASRSSASWYWWLSLHAHSPAVPQDAQVLPVQASHYTVLVYHFSESRSPLLAKPLRKGSPSFVTPLTPRLDADRKFPPTLCKDGWHLSKAFGDQWNPAWTSACNHNFIRVPVPGRVQVLPCGVILPVLLCPIFSVNWKSDLQAVIHTKHFLGGVFHNYDVYVRPHHLRGFIKSDCSLLVKMLIDHWVKVMTAWSCSCYIFLLACGV